VSRRALAVVCAGALLGPLDTSVNVAFPAITEAFALALRDIQWVVIGYVLAQTGLTLLFGRLGDRLGHRRIFALGVASGALTHLAVGFAPDYATLVGLRVLQGVSVALTLACAPALATLLFPPDFKRRAIGIYTMATSLGMALGPLLGGLLVEFFGWPGVFWFRVPLALAVVAALPWLPDVRAAGPAAPGTGAAAASAGAASSEGAPGQATPPRAAAGRGLGRRRFAPGFVPLQAASVAINFACFANLLLVPYVLAGWSGTAVVAAGVLLALFPGGSVLGSLLASRASRGVGSGAMATGGMLLAALGLMATAVVLGWREPMALAATLALCGLGLGIFQVGYMDATTSMLPPQDRGVAGSLVSVTRLLGVVLGAVGIGWLHEALGAFVPTFGVLGAALAALAGAAWLLRRRGPVSP
jgi:MFS family permease